MEMVNVVTVAASGSIGSGWSAWSKDRRPPGARATFGWTLAVAVHCCDDSAI